MFASDAGFRQRCCYSDDEDSDEFSSLVLGPPYGGHVVDTVSDKPFLPYSVFEGGKVFLFHTGLTELIL